MECYSKSRQIKIDHRKEIFFRNYAIHLMIRSVRMVFGIIVAAAAASVVLEIGIINVSYAQVTPSQLTPEQKSKICDPNDKFVNSTESKICGIPKTPLAASPTTTTPSSPKPISPSSPGSITPPSETTPQEPIPGLP